MLPLTPSQTVGPFFALLVPARGRASLVSDHTAESRIVVEGSVHDGAGHCNHPADSRTHGPDPTFDGFGRVHTDAYGRFALETIKPGLVPGPEGQPQASHLVLGLFARGLLTRLVTRIYFENEPSNAPDPILACVATHRRSTLVASRSAAGRYRFEIVLQGPQETVFFDV